MKKPRQIAVTIFAWISLASVVGALTTIIIVSGTFLLVGIGARWLADTLDKEQDNGRK